VTPFGNRFDVTTLPARTLPRIGAGTEFVLGAGTEAAVVRRWDNRVMNRSIRALAPPPWGPLAAVIVGWLGIILGLAVMLILDARIRDAGRGDLAQFGKANTLYVVAVVSSAITGSALAIRRPWHPVGWLFLAVGVSILVSGVIDGYAAYGNVARPGTAPAAALAAVIADSFFVPWLMLLGLIMLLTPGGRLDAPLWRLAAWAIVVGGIATFTVGMLRPYQGPFRDRIENPIEVSSLAEVFPVLGTSALVALHAGVILGAVSLVVRYRAARDEERLQLRWLGWVAAPFALLVIAAWVAAYFDSELILNIVGAGFLSVIPVTAALAIERYHLYDVERLVSRGLLWLLLSMVLVSCYTIVVVFVGESLGGDSQIPAVVATLAAVSIVGRAGAFCRMGSTAISTAAGSMQSPPSAGTLASLPHRYD
jgi:hypothetical protein